MARYEVPKNSGKHCNFLGSLWLGGFDMNSILHTSAMTYRQKGVDFWPGPLDTLNGTTDSLASAAFDLIWKVNKWQIDSFIVAFNNGSVTASTYTIPQAIMSWPAHGNTAAGYAARLAPFVDVNNDGLYNPKAHGDYPLIRGDQMIYYICNDNTSLHTETGGLAFGIEMHVSAYAYGCGSLLSAYPELNNTTFYHYRVINRTNNRYNNVWATVFSDVDIGWHWDDMIGCDTSLNIGYAFNGNYWDQSYKDSPPVLSYQILRGPPAPANDGKDNNKNGFVDEFGEDFRFSSFMYFRNNLGTAVPANSNPHNAIDYYSYMKAYWLDGRPLRADSTGFLHVSSTVQPTSYAFSGDPQVLTGWSEYTRNNSPSDRRMLIGNGPFDLGAYEEFEVEYSILTTFDDTAGTNGHKNIARVRAENAVIKNFYGMAVKPACTFTTSTTGIGEGGSLISLKLVPNPASDKVEVVAENMADGTTVELINSLGLTVGRQQLSSGKTSFDLSGLPPGVYIVKVSSGAVTHFARLVRN